MNSVLWTAALVILPVLATALYMWTRSRCPARQSYSGVQCEATRGHHVGIGPWYTFRDDVPVERHYAHVSARGYLILVTWE